MQDSLFESVVSRPRLQELTASRRIVAFIAFVAAVFRFKTGGLPRQKSISKRVGSCAPALGTGCLSLFGVERVMARSPDRAMLSCSTRSRR